MEDKIDIRTQNQKDSTCEMSLSTKCSCSECDSMLCFTKRRFPTCLCSDCKNSQTCTFKNHENNDKITKADQINEAYLNSSKFAKPPEMDPTALTRSGINFDLARKRAIEANKPKPKSLDEYLSILLPETTTSKVNYKTKPDSLAQYIDIITTGNIPSQNKESSLDIYIKKFKEAKREKPSELACSENLLHNKQRAFTPMAQNTTCKGTCKKCRQIKYTQIQNVMLTTPIINVNPRIAKLSSEIMDLSYKGSSSSISAFSNIEEEEVRSSEVSTEATPTLKYDFFNYDILKKIKDVYKACSCKVCECIPTKMFKGEVCNCKPCECIECTRYLNTLDTKTITKPLYHLKCTCNKYKYGSKKGFSQKAKDCSCNPCNCAQCQNKDFQKSCNCNPCQCTDCKYLVPLYQIFRGEVHQNSPCQCLPCKCTECLRRYGASSKDAMHEVSTTTSRQSQCQCEICPNDTCKDSLETCICDNRNIFKKPVDRVRHDYDIRTATIINDKYHHGDDINALGKQNAETNFAAFSQKYQIPSSVKVCNSKECECINCDRKEDAITAIKSSRLFSCESNLSTNDDNEKSYDFKLCKCCINKEGKSCHIKKHTFLRQTFKSEDRQLKRLFNQNDCNCIGDSAVSEKPYEHDHKHSVCQHSFANIHSHANFLGSWPIKKGDVLTPSAHQRKIEKQITAKSKLSTSLTSKMKSLNKIVCTDGNYNKLKEYYPKFVKPRSLVQLKEFNDLKQNKMEKNDESHNVSQCNVYIKNQILKEDISILKHNLIHNMSDSNISEFSFSGANSEISFCKQNYVTTTISEQEHKYYHDDNYGSGHNHPRYIIRGSTVDTCLNDVLKSDFAKEIKLTDLNVSLKRSDDLTENNKSEKSVSSFIDIQGGNDRNQCIKERKITKKKYYHCHLPTYIKNHNNCNNTCLSHKLYKTNTFRSNKYEAESKQDENCQQLQNYNKTNLAHRYNCYSCYNLSNIKSNNIYKDEGSCAEVKYSYCKDFDNIIENFNIKEDHERVHETLKDAKKFYLHLLQLLETYEKANREFQSISAKLKISHINLITEKNTNIKYVKTDNLNKLSKEIPTHLTVAPKVESLPPNNRIFENVNDENISQRPVMTDFLIVIPEEDCITKSEINHKTTGKLKSYSVNEPYHSSGNLHSTWMPTFKHSLKSENENGNSFTNLKKIKQKPHCSDKCSFAGKPTEENKATILHSMPDSEINDLKYLIHSVMKPEGDETLRINKSLNSEDQKVKFQSVRKVSAHSVLIKWKPPLDLRNVRGYEMLVDGQPVQKIFSPYNSIAVVTCLPQSDKLEITIRTITYSSSKIYPTATIVYQTPTNKYGFKH